MKNIDKEAEFYKFMKSNGPNAKTSRSNYISWLRFIADNFQNFDESLDRDKIEEICLSLKEKKNIRNKYTKNKDISNIKSALNKYHKFNKSISNYSEIMEDIFSILTDDLSPSQKYDIEVRTGQGKYRNELLKIWRMCSLTKYSKTDFLIASHIKPWKDSTNLEKTDPYNGLLLKPNIDKLFDSGYITFSDKGTIIISSLLDDTDKENMGISNDMELYKVCKEHKPYLEYHRHKIFIE